MVGEFYIVLAVLINSIVLLNFIIAILADTYSKLSGQSLGLYYDGIISRIPVYEDDSRYGSLIVGTLPFNSLAIIMVPLFCCIKNERRLNALNDKCTKVMFAPIALIVTLAFVAINLALLPLAYLSALYHKLKLLCLASTQPQGKNPKRGSDNGGQKAGRSSRQQYFEDEYDLDSNRSYGSLEVKTIRATSQIFTDLVIFIFFGVGILFMSQFVDAFYFLWHIYRVDVKEFGH